MKKLQIIVLGIMMLFSMPIIAQSSSLADVVRSFRSDTRAIYNYYTFHESKECYQRLFTLYDDWEKNMDTISFDLLSQEEKVDFLLLSNLIEKERYLLELDYESFEEVVYVYDFTKALFPFIQKRRRGQKPDSKKLAQIFQDALAQIEKETEKLKEKPFKNWIVADKASEIIVSFTRALEEAYDFYDKYDPEFSWWIKQPYDDLMAKLVEYEYFLKDHYSNTDLKDDGSGIIGKPIGREALLKSLAFEYIPYTPEELIKIGEEQFKWCKKEMLKASQELGYGDDWQAAFEHVKNTYVPLGEQPEMITGLYDESIEFIEELDLITLPELAKETWRMDMMSAGRQKLTPYFTGGWTISVSYPTNEMDHDDKMMSMRGNNPSFSRAVVHHELLPGHNLQRFMNSRYKTYRNAFDTPFWMEGWALYWEIILWNKGFANSPEDKLGMLFWRTHRCARIIFSLKYHLGQMTPQECIDLLVNEVGHEYANAEAEVRRSFTGGYPPLYQAAYMLGGLQFYALRNEMLAKGWTEKEFHDRVMQENLMPIELMRALFQEIPLEKEDKTKWKFDTAFEK